LCDRFTDSSEAYQGAGRGLGSDAVLRVHEVICRGLQPDMTIYMDSDVEHSVNRARRRNQRATDSSPAEKDENRFEQESRAFFERVQEAFRAIARREPERVFMVDARQPGDKVHPQIVAAVRQRLM
jgi:dTMP kinase